MTQSDARSAPPFWPQQSIAAVSAFCAQAAPQSALLVGSFADFDCGNTIRQHHQMPADILSVSESSPWPENTFLRIAAIPDRQGCDIIHLLLAEWLRICMPQGRLLLLAANPYYWQHFRQPENIAAPPPEYLTEAAASLGWELLETLYFNHEKNASVKLLKNLFGRCICPVYALHLQKRVYAVPPAEAAAATENIELSALGIACRQSKPL